MAHFTSSWTHIDRLTLPYMLTACLTSFVLYIVCSAFYNLFLHPLRNFPGPKLAAATPLYHAYWAIRGKKHVLDAKLHAKYGDVVRMKPNHLSFTGESAWKDIFMHRQGQPQFAKWGRGGVNTEGVYNIINAPDDIHARLRKSLSHAFSEKALRDQEPLITTYIDKLIANIRQDAQEGKPSNMKLYFEWATFDIIGDLAFAQSFDALETRNSHMYIREALGRLDLIVTMNELSRIAVVGTAARLLLFPFLAPTRKRMLQHSGGLIEKRRQAGQLARPDFAGKVMEQNAYKDAKAVMSDSEMKATFQVLILAGSETTATSLAGCIYLLLKNPKAFEKLNAEVRSAFNDEKEINVTSINKLPYLLAVIEEALRLYPPVPISFPRETPASGATICGRHVPGNVVVAVSQLTASYSDRYFADPLDFIPERFLPNADPKFDNDKRAMLQPFSAGPRNCLGRNLAYAEMKLILARIVYNFDLELVDKDQVWTDQKLYLLWVKPDLQVIAKERVVGVVDDKA